MTITNKNDANKAAVLERLSAVRSALKNEPPNPSAARALEQCDRLELAITQFHAEGLRFAAFTLLPNGVRARYGFYRACPDRYTKFEKCLRNGRLSALMERVVPGAPGRARGGGPTWWARPCSGSPLRSRSARWSRSRCFRVMRAWLGCAVLLMWTCFFTANAVRSRRTHSIISAPVYFLAAALLAGSAWG